MARARAFRVVIALLAGLGALAWGMLLWLGTDVMPAALPTGGDAAAPARHGRRHAGPACAPAPDAQTRSERDTARVALDAAVAPKLAAVRTATIRGRIESEDGAPIPDAAIEIAGIAPVHSDQAGLFAVRVAHGFAGDLQVHGRGYVPAHLPSVQAGEQVVCVLVRGARLSGCVVDAADHTPIAGAETSVRIGSRSLSRASDDTGQVSFDDLPYGSAELRITSLGYEILEEHGLSVTATTPPREWQLEPGRWLNGRVLDAATQKPIARASVQYFIARDEQPRREVQSDVRGLFDLGILGIKQARVRVAAEGYLVAEDDLGSFAPEPGSPLVFRLSPGVIVCGRVIAPDGSPVPGCALTARAWGDPMRVESDARGEFRFNGLPPQTISIVASHPRHGVFAEPVALVLPQTSVVLQFPAPASISGVVVNGADAVPGARVALVVESRSVRALGCSDRQQVSDERGRFAFTGLASGGYLIAARTAELESDFFSVGVGEGQRGELSITMRESATIECNVVADGGRPLAQASIRATQLQKPGDDPRAKLGWTWVLATRQADDRGRFTIHGVRRSGPVLISAAARGHASATCEAMAGENVTISLKPHGLIRGRVVDAATRAPVPNFYLDLEAEPATRSTHGATTADGASWHAIADAEGRFCIARLAAGAYIVRAHADEFLDGEWLAVTTADVVRYAPEWELFLVRGGSCSGMVVDQGGAPAGNVPVFLIATAASARLEATGDDGSFRFLTVAPGRYRLGVGIPKVSELCSEEVELPLATSTAKVLRVATLRALTVRVRDSRGEPVFAAPVQASALFDNATVHGHEMKARTDREGRAVFPHMLPTRYAISSSHEGERGGRHVSLADAEPIAELEIALR